MVKGFHKLPYKLRLKKLKPTNLKKETTRRSHRDIQDLDMQRKMSCLLILDKNLHNTRGHKLHNSRSRLELRRNFFSQRVVPYWNKLQETVVTTVTVNTFKNRLDRCAEWSI